MNAAGGWSQCSRRVHLEMLAGTTQKECIVQNVSFQLCQGPQSCVRLLGRAGMQQRGTVKLLTHWPRNCHQGCGNMPSAPAPQAW